MRRSVRRLGFRSVLCLALLLAGGGCRKDAPRRPGSPPAGEPAPVGRDPAHAAADPPPEPLSPPASPSGDEAQNEPPIALYLAERLQWVDRVVSLRVEAEPGDYFNCYYKGRENAYHHLRLRGDGSAHLDGYVPRDEAGERLMGRLVAGQGTRMTVRVVTRQRTLSGICVGQVDIIDHAIGWRFDPGTVGPPGARRRRLRNLRDREPPHNDPTVADFSAQREQYRDRTARLRLRARLARSYRCRYRDAERTHYVLYLQGAGYKGLEGYLARNERSAALARRLARDEGARLTVTLNVPAGRFDPLCSDQAEIVDWSFGW